MKILIVAPYYAPSSEVPSVRMVSLSEYLVKNGHDVIVMGWSREKLLTVYKESELRSSVPEGVKVIDFGYMKKMIPFIDDLKSGKDFSAKIDKVLSSDQYDVVFITCGPYFTLKAVPLIKKKYNIPCVLDFRDLGAINYRPKLGSEGSNDTAIGIKKLVKNWYFHKVYIREKKAVESADGIICVSAIDKEKMVAEYNAEEKNYIIATNGFDDVKLSQIVPVAKSEGITGAVFGKFMYYSRPRATAILKAINQKRASGVNISLMHIGRHYDYIDEAISVNNIGKDVFRPIGLKAYEEGMAILGSADFFVVEDTSPDDVGTKIYDYIFWNKPVIAAVPKNIPLAKLVSSFENGYVCETEEDVTAALDDILTNHKVYLDSRIDTNNYSRTHQNKKMERFVEDIVSRR